MERHGERRLGLTYVSHSKCICFGPFTVHDDYSRDRVHTRVLLVRVIHNNNQISTSPFAAGARSQLSNQGVGGCRVLQSYGHVIRCSTLLSQIDDHGGRRCAARPSWSALSRCAVQQRHVTGSRWDSHRGHPHAAIATLARSFTHQVVPLERLAGNASHGSHTPSVAQHALQTQQRFVHVGEVGWDKQVILRQVP